MAYVRNSAGKIARFGGKRIGFPTTVLSEPLISLNNLVGYWTFDETSGTIIDKSDYSNDSVAVGSGVTYAQNGKIGNALSFNMTNNAYVLLPDVSSLSFESSDMTFGCWFYTSGADQQMGLFGGDSASFALDTYDGRHIFLGNTLQQAYNFTSLRYNVSAWNFVAVVFDSTATTNNATLYLNGDTETITANFNGSPGASTRVIGLDYLYGVPFDGLIDEPFMFKGRKLTISELDIIYNNGDGHTFEELKGNIPLSAPTVTTSTVTSIGTTYATAGGNVTNDGNLTTYRGVCVGTNNNPTIIDVSLQHASTGEGSYTVNFTNLDVSTLYYTRAFAYNSRGLSYGSSVSFATNASEQEQQVYSDSTLLNGLGGYWKMDQTSGNAIDSLGLHDGDASGLIGVTYGNDGILDKSFTFTYGDNGTDQAYLEFGTGVFHYPELTFSCWLYRTDDNPDHPLCFVSNRDGNTHGIDFWIYNGTWITAAQVFNGTDSVTSYGDTSLNLNTWYHYLITVGDNYIRQYLNNVEVDAASFTYDISYNNQCSFRIGANDDRYACFGGRIDEIGIWNRVLDASERAELYNNGYGATYPFAISTTQIIADHTIVDDYQYIPQQYIDQIKKMWLVYAGESHSEGIRIGLQELEDASSKYAVSIVDSGTPEADTSANLRASRGTWGDVDNATGWIYGYGEEDWFTSSTAISRTKAGINYCNTHDLSIAAIGFGWCWDQGVDNSSYLSATQEYVEYCSSMGYQTKVIFTTGPVDNGYTLQEGYLKSIDYASTRTYVESDPNLILFDYADILCYDDNGDASTQVYDGHTYPYIASFNMDDGTFAHIGIDGCRRLGKAMWWMLARIAGWDGKIVITDDFQSYTAGISLAGQGNWDTNKIGDMRVYNVGGNLQVYPYAVNTESCLWRTEVFNKNQFSQITASNVSTGSCSVGCAVRAKFTDASNNSALVFKGNNNFCYVGYIYNGSYVNLATTYDSSIKTGDTLRLEAIDSSLKCFLNGAICTSLPGGGIYTLNSSFNEGSPGISGWDDNTLNRLDNWEGGEL